MKPIFRGPQATAGGAGQLLQWVVSGARTACFVGAMALVFAASPLPSQGLATAAEVDVKTYASAEEAYEAGRSAMTRGDFRGALAPLRAAAGAGVFLAKFYLAEILSDTRHIFADPMEAYGLYAELIDSNPDVDPTYDYRANFVARAYVMVGRYLSGVLPIDGIEQSQSRARRLFGHAATYLDYPDAQFEFARMLLRGRGGAQNVRSGKHYLSTLSRRGHAAAQGYLAELFWNGEFVPKRHDFALALSTLAVQNTPQDDRIWLDELHHEISCATSAQIHEDADSLLKRWQKAHPREKLYPTKRDDAFAGSGGTWSCGKDPLPAPDGDAALVSSSDDAESKEAWPDQNRLEALHGDMSGFGGQ